MSDLNTLSPDDRMRYLDSSYHPFPSFAEWTSLTLDTTRWDSLVEQLNTAKEDPAVDFQRARDVIQRAAAIETGVIEGLYPADRGFTITAAEESAIWEAALSQRDERVRHLIQSQMEAYDYVLDFATEAQPIAEAWIRELHVVICSAQDSYTVTNATGTHQQNLPKGQYKSVPNHVLTSSGEPHAYAPVAMTGSEMQRYCAELVSESFKAAHPVLQAAYAHYAFVAIHPFADGNGRVARAVASIFMYRALSVPLLITDERKYEYFDALEAADRGHYAIFTRFLFERAIDTIRLVIESLTSARRPSARDMLKSVQRLYTTRGGYNHRDVDQAALSFFDAFFAEMQRQSAEIHADGTLSLNISKVVSSYASLLKHYRWTVINGRQELFIEAIPAQSREVKVKFHFGVMVPTDCGHDDDLVILNYETGDSVRGLMREIHPELSLSCSMRIRVACERMIATLLEHVEKALRNHLRSLGY
jgi:Fic family protein